MRDKIIEILKGFDDCDTHDAIDHYSMLRDVWAVLMASSVESEAERLRRSIANQSIQLANADTKIRDMVKALGLEVDDPYPYQDLLDAAEALAQSRDEQRSALGEERAKVRRMDDVLDAMAEEHDRAGAERLEEIANALGWSGNPASNTPDAVLNGIRAIKHRADDLGRDMVCAGVLVDELRMHLAEVRLQRDEALNTNARLVGAVCDLIGRGER